ncbi:Radical SAM domain protein [Olavius sp. associated proteobacterium Delta 1]|nr:Radical SAM domain protein [Olavius sp. associated proteobacterium Delta 1]
MVEFVINKLRSGGLITNYFCTSSCKHCLYNCSPHWERRYIDPDTAEKNLKTIRALGCRSVHIGGGEPLLRPDKLGTVLEIAAGVGVSVEYVETNSSWFRDIESAKALLSRLRPKGLRTLLVSISPFHNEQIPFSKVQGVIEAAGQVGVGIFPWITDFVSDLSQLDPAKTHCLDEYRQLFGDNYLMQILQRYWIHLGGRALETFRPLLGEKTSQQIIAENPAGCAAELTDTSHFHIDLFGNYIPGLCSGLAISKDALGTPLSTERYPILMDLYHNGIRGLFEFAEKNYAFSPQRIDYINKCDLCTEIRTHLVINDYNQSNELKPAEFYMNLA